MSVIYKYMLETSRSVLDRGHLFSGTIKVAKEMSDDEVHLFARSMCNAFKGVGTQLIKCVKVDA